MGDRAASFPPFGMGASKSTESPFSFLATKRKFPCQAKTIFLTEDMSLLLVLDHKNLSDVFSTLSLGAKPMPSSTRRNVLQQFS
jgi:hypothetical protein